MNNKFSENLKKLCKQYSQKHIAESTGFSQSSVNNYLAKTSEPSIQFLIALKDAFGICVDDFLFSDFEIDETKSFDRFVGNYMVYYYNNDSYKGEVHTNLKNTLNYGVLSIFKEHELDKSVQVVATFFKDRVSSTKMLKNLNNSTTLNEIINIFMASGNQYSGHIRFNQQSIFIELENKENNDNCFIILNNPPATSNYVGGIGTVNSVARGREHNPCIQYIILSKNILDVPDGEIYNCLKFDDYSVDLEVALKDVIDLFKRLYVEKNEISLELTGNQKQAIVQNKLEFHFNEILQANAFRFAKISNKEDDDIYKLIKEGIDV